MELKLNAEQTQAFRIMLFFAELSRLCIYSEQNNFDSFSLHIKTKCPSGDRGEVLTVETTLYAEVVSQTDSGWIGSVKCPDFRKFLSKNYNDSPEGLLAVFWESK